MKKIISLILTIAIMGSMSAAFAEDGSDGYLAASSSTAEMEIETIDDYSVNNDKIEDDETADAYEITDAGDLYAAAEMEFSPVVNDEISADDSFNISDGFEITEMTDESPMAYAYSSSRVPAYLFDANYYATKYDDLMAAFGTNKSKLYNHWLTYGKKEGRSPTPVYDADYYLNNNADLRAAFGTNYSALYDHFVTYGIKEFRKSSPIYDGGYYKTHYSDLQNAFGNNSESYINHFMDYGMKEGRQASNDFNAQDYKSRYTDLQNAFGSNMKSYYYHYMEYGVREGRNAKPSGSNSPAAVPDTTSNSSSESSKTAWAKTSGSNLNMRAGTSTGTRIVCKIPNGSQITVYGSAINGFYKAAYAGKTGYVSSGYVSFSQPSGGGGSSSGGGCIIDNVSRVSLIKQGSKTCKATAVAQSLNIITGQNRYSTRGMGGSNCNSIQGKTYTGTDGRTYVATYKTDSYRGSASEQMSKINAAISAGLPIIVAVHKTSSGTKHHWVTIIGRSGNTYEIIDPATGTRRTMANARYAFGLADYSNGYHYGYISFTRR